jgi:hypothetical protein
MPLQIQQVIVRWTVATCFGQCLLVYTKSRKKHIKGAHGLHSGIILESCVAARALRMHWSITIVLFERTCARVGPITNAAGDGNRRNWTMDGGGVLGPMLTCLGTSQKETLIKELTTCNAASSTNPMLQRAHFGCTGVSR